MPMSEIGINKTTHELIAGSELKPEISKSLSSDSLDTPPDFATLYPGY